MAEMLVQKPQFDIKVLSPGTPIKLTLNTFSNRSSDQRVKTGIIVEAFPLEIRMEYWRESSGSRGSEAEMNFCTISVDHVASGEYTIEVLKPELDKSAVERQIKTLITEALHDIGRTPEAYINEVRRQIRVTARLLGLEPENLMPDLMKEAETDADFEV